MKNRYALVFWIAVSLVLAGCHDTSKSNSSPPFTIQITNPDTYPTDGTLNIALCENEAGVLKSSEARLAILAIANKRWDSSSAGAGTYTDYMTEGAATYYSDEKDVSSVGVLDAKIKINLWDFSKEKKTSSGCPILPIQAFKQSRDWANFGMCPYDKAIVVAYYRGKKIDQVSSGCKVGSKPKVVNIPEPKATDPCYWKSLIIGTWSQSGRPDRISTFLPDGTTSYKEKGQTVKWACSDDGQLEYIYPGSLSGDYPSIFPIKSIDDNSMVMGCWVNYRRENCTWNKVK